MLEIATIFQPLIDGGVAVLEFWQGVTGDWGVAIILLAFTIQLAFFPVAFIQRAAEDRLDALQPELKELEERFAGYKERLDKEVGRLYERRKAGRAVAFVPIVLLLSVFVWIAGYYLFESQAFKDAIGGSEPFLFLPDLAEPLRDDPFVLAAMMALSLGMVVVRRRIKRHGTQLSGQLSTRAWWATSVPFLVLFIFLPAGFIVFLIAMSIWNVGEDLVLNNLLPGAGASTSEHP